MRSPLLLLTLLCLLFLPGCNEEQIRQAEAIAAAAHARMDQADQAVALATAAVAKADELAKTIGSVRAEAIVGQAQQALVAAGAAREAAKMAVDAGDAAVKGARAAQDAGGSSVTVAIAALTALVPSLGGLALALKNMFDAGRALKQTVAGIEAAKETMQPDQVAKLHAALNTTQDESVKATVALVKAKAVAALLAFAFLVPCWGADAVVGLGPVPTATTLLAPGPIGSTTPSTGAFTTLSSSGATTMTAGTASTTTATGTLVVTGGIGASGQVSANALLASGLTSGRIPFAGTGGLLGDNGNLQYASTTGVTAIGSTKGGVFTTTDSGTSNITDTLNCYHRTSGTPLAGFAAVINIGADSSTNSLRNILTVRGEWIDPTDASRTGRVSFFTYDTSAREFMRADASGSVAKLGFFGATAVVKPAATDDLRTALINLGLYTTGGASPLDLNGGALTTAAATHSGVTSVTDTTDATTATTASLKTLGGLGVTKNIVGKQGLGVGVASVVTAAGTTTMTSASAACQVFTGSTTQSLTLPAANVFGAGIAYVVYVKNVSTGLVTVQRAGSDTINSTASNVTSFTLAQWASCTLYSDGVSAWERF